MGTTTNEQPVLLRSANEVQRAHDRLWAIVTSEVNIGLDLQELTFARCQLDVLCWLLGHDHNRTFEGNLQLVAEQFTARGIREEEAPRPMTVAEWQAEKRNP